MSKYDSAASVLNSLLELGVAVALDDFGTQEYSPHLPCADYRSVASDRPIPLFATCCAAGLRAIVKSVIALARDLNIGVVAEGVESTEQLVLRHTMRRSPGIFSRAACASQ